MNLVVYEAGGIALLHLFALLSGLALSITYTALKCFPRFIITFGMPQFQKFSLYKHFFLTENSGYAYVVFSDILIAVLMAATVLSLAFIRNSGNFRVLSVGSLLIGYFIGHRLFDTLILGAMSVICYVLKLTSDIIMLPIKLIVKLLIISIGSLTDKISSLYKNIVIKKHTERAVKNAAYFAKNGFLDNYEEYLK